MPNEVTHEGRASAEDVRSLSSLPHAPPLPDPDLIWMRAQLLASEEAELAALRNEALARVLRYGLVAAGGTWLAAEVAGLDEWLRGATSPASVTTSALIALGAAVVVSGLLLGRSFVAQRLRDFGLL